MSGKVGKISVQYHGDTGDGVPQNIELSTYCFKKAVELCDFDAMYNYEVCIRNGEGVPQNIELSVFWFKKAGELGDIDAMLKYGVCLRNRKSVTQYIESVGGYKIIFNP